ncbi:hypothetical protein ACFWE3_06645 [Mycobacteriaceae bacterium NPDC060252]
MTTRKFLSPSQRALTDQCRADTAAALDSILDAHAREVLEHGPLDDAEDYLGFLYSLARSSDSMNRVLLAEALMRLRRAGASRKL